MKYKKQKFPFTQSFIHITKRPGVVLLLSYTRITEIMQHLGTNISRKYNYKKKTKKQHAKCNVALWQHSVTEQSLLSRHFQNITSARVPVSG